ncbi:MAG: TetR/AcrR family transcriptional regulator [Tessaracoccus sp.]|uniref:TetR/AcrR family transcriptional regulator n=1 Tax=Tessaracoccus sp. TaxID=1971211 RepID=UPI001ED4C2D2|nr:TetR/AcrR family transcriptional regulator [Tessaracoccus sp.]MBK7822889.1 TetR/AcrR family transcriptional regulator [Tessaracoccus sp.]
MSKSARRPRTGPKSRPETIRKRKEILEAAAEVFGSKGYEKATLQEIADQVGLTHAGVLHHFGSKRNLLIETVRYRDFADLAMLGRKQIPMGRAQFDHLIATAFRNSERPGIVQAFEVLSAEALTDDSPVLGYFLKRYRTLQKEISTNFRKLCAAEGIVEPATIDQATASILAVMDGLQYQWLIDPDDMNLGETTAFAIRTIVDAVLGPEKPRAKGAGATAAPARKARVRSAPQQFVGDALPGLYGPDPAADDKPLPHGLG